MSVIYDVLKVLDRTPIWKRLQSVPIEVDDLGARRAEEAKLAGKWPPCCMPSSILILNASLFGTR